VEDSDEEEAPKLSHEQTLQTAPVTSPKITIAERRLKTPKSKLSKTSQANTKTNGVNGEIYAKSTAIPTIVPSIELPPQAATPVPSKLKMESIPASTRSTNNTSRNIQPEAKALIDELFAPKLKRKSPSNGSDEHNTEVKSVKKKKNVSHEEPADEKIAPKFLAHDKRKSDVSMKNASAISTPEPEAKSRKTSLSARHQASNANEAQTPPIQEYEDVREDITAEVDAKMQQYRNHRNREEKLKKLGVNAADKRSRKSFEKDESKVQMKQESGTSSVKKRKIDGSKTEKPKFRGLLGPVERKRKSLSLDDVDPFFAEGAALKKEKKFPISHKKVRKDGWESDGDAVMD
jgi:hypothetical protein